jgi:hypothetical protein
MVVATVSKCLVVLGGNVSWTDLQAEALQHVLDATGYKIHPVGHCGLPKAVVIPAHRPLLAKRVLTPWLPSYTYAQQQHTHSSSHLRDLQPLFKFKYFSQSHWGKSGKYKVIPYHSHVPTPIQQKAPLNNQ